MSSMLRLVLVFHNHQPIGNFDGVFEQAYQDSYRPFLEVFEQYPGLPIALHTSGSLMEWLVSHHPEYIDRLAALVAAGRIEIVGGAYYEPILTMIPSRDRVGQITRYAEWLSERFDTTVSGMWMPERVWEQSLTGDLVDAGVRYTLLDDFHFKNAGLDEDQLHGYYITEDDGQAAGGSARQRAAAVHDSVPRAAGDDRLPAADRRASSRARSCVFGDDGEKFGSWPGTKQHVYENGWLRRFFDALAANRDWLQVVTPTKALDEVPPLGKVYIPEGSYREMTEWVLPAKRLVEFENLRHRLGARRPLAGGRAVRPRRLLAELQGEVSRNERDVLPHADGQPPAAGDGGRAAPAATLIDQARTELYRGQCNCGYWHGAFGGAYLPHLRNAVYEHLIAADNLLDAAQGRGLADGDQPGSS